MINTILTTGVALLATRALAGPGQAIVINSCSYDVNLANTPASGGGYNTINQVLSSGGSYSQTWTQLSNGDGWSIKLAKDTNFDSDLMQYEYTYHDDGTIWYDLSEVNGNPWDGNWEITATSGCTPRQAAYRYSTDDAYGMQSCSDSASITVTLCSGTSGGAPSGGAPSTPSYASSPPSVASSAPIASNTWAIGNHVVESPADAVDNKPAPTPSPSPATTQAPVDNWNGPAVTITNIAWATVTETMTAGGPPPRKRHVHHPRHPHGHHA